MISARFARAVMKHIHDFEHIGSFIVFCNSVEATQKWKDENNFEKIIEITNKFETAK